MDRDSIKALRDWNSQLAELMDPASSQDLAGKIVTACNSLVTSDAAIVEVFTEASRPVSLFDNVPEEDQNALVDAYVAGAYLLDPYYRAGTGGIEAGMYRLVDVAPGGFAESEYYRRFYKESRIIDEVVFVSHMPDGSIINLSLVRLAGSPKYSSADIELLDAIQPVVDRILVRCQPQREEPEATTPLRSQLEDALARFGNSVLTSREAQVVRLYLQGHSTKSICDQLFISSHTVTTHRRSAYLKLDVNSQGELFHLFIDSISCFDPGEPRDPLRGYLSVRDEQAS